MQDEIYDRGYQAGRFAFHGGIDRLARKLAETFHAFARIQFEAPWQAKPKARA